MKFRNSSLHAGADRQSNAAKFKKGWNLAAPPLVYAVLTEPVSRPWAPGKPCSSVAVLRVGPVFPGRAGRDGILRQPLDRTRLPGSDRFFRGL